MLGRLDDAYRVATSAVAAAEHLGIPRLHREMLADLACHEAVAGDVARGLRTAEQAFALADPGSDPHGDILIVVIRTEILLRFGAGADDVEAAAGPGLALAARLGDRATGRPFFCGATSPKPEPRAGLVGRAAALDGHP